jgi:hypothetical protein
LEQFCSRAKPAFSSTPIYNRRQVINLPYKT